MAKFLLPDLGEGLEGAEIVAWHVSEGDYVTADQPLISVETDKAIVEIPSPQSGRIMRLFGGKGDLIKVGGELVEFDERERADTGTVVGRLEHEAESADETLKRQATPLENGIRAAPAVRALARKLDIDLRAVAATGPNGSITTHDVERAAGLLPASGAAEPLRGVRRAMAQRMSVAHEQAVRAAVVDEADTGDWPPGEDITVRLLRAIAVACKAEPSLNAWYNAQAGERQLITRIDIGIAVDTEEGLIVPVLRDVGERDAADLRKGLDRLRHDTIARTVPPHELRGATISLSNFGMFGGRFAYLVVVPPQVAIVGAGRREERLVAKCGAPAVRPLLPLSLTFDHRAVTGGEAARFLAVLKADLEQAR
jgi:pyruvate dehydrogenase E2 component (dihydrolipoamide acetyltransferase)